MDLKDPYLPIFEEKSKRLISLEHSKAGRKFNKYCERISENENFESILKESYEGLKKCTNYEQKIDEDFRDWAANLQQAKLINQFNLHITMLGILDYRIDELRNKQTKKINAETEHNNLIMQRALLEKRQNLTNEIIETIKPDVNIEEAIKIYPTYSALSSLYENAIKENPRHIGTKINYFISSYNNGYALGTQKPLEYYEYRYEQILSELTEHLEKQKTRGKK